MNKTIISSIMEYFTYTQDYYANLFYLYYCWKTLCICVKTTRMLLQKMRANTEEYHVLKGDIFYSSRFLIITNVLLQSVIN